LMVKVDQNKARNLPVLLIDNSDHVTVKTGVTEDEVTVKISKNLAAFTLFDLTGKWVELGNGVYEISFAGSDLDTIGFFAYIVLAPGCDQYSGLVYVAAPVTKASFDI
ncbi:MAG: hypothetical protein J7M38_14845, partial [Armatimonadetes bacterium]|nr:hypothetical protein [Armatimonadota bacterium]